ncbi:protein kinase [Mycolicibacterium celeriflavum]|uniref:serine/threonine-protein kinase n=1 Tax=Mycolicibacterium celeriflavum TaxID=1249101 RepID=UPI0008014A3B|nr:serine/threonine-protein kinase [Mycolicibacterium celeriflavum]OBG23519.1 protein kinase [Mycolicibacterium celeriflavum]
MPLADGTKIAGYTIRRMLGAGGMGEVYLAQHPRLPREDALKVLRSDISSDPDFVERFNREADLAANLWHPHIVGIHDRGKYRGRLWISMDFVDGTDVSRLLQQYPNGMPADEAIEIVKAVAGALDYAHTRGLLHRDVKPANILVADIEHVDRRILLGDFGVARDLADDTGGGLTATNMTVGTAAYAAPEQLMGLDVDGRTDQYSLAVTAYHMLTGAPPFKHSKAAVVIGQHLNATPPPLADTHPELASLDPVMARALAKDPDHRFASCMDFARALQDSAHTPLPPVLNDAETMARPIPPAGALEYPTGPTVAAPAERRGNRLRWVLPVAAALLAVVLVAAYFAFAPDRDEPAGEPFTLAGTARLPTDTVKTSGLPGGYKCVGAGEYGDVSPMAPVTVEDEAGKLLAKGAIQSSNSGRDACLLLFRVDNVPTGARFYRVKVAQQPEMSFTETEAKAGVEIVLGTADAAQEPTATTAPTSKSTPKPPPPRPTRTVTVTPGVETNSLNQLRAIAAEDRPYVAAEFTDIWVPQISSKRVGLEAEGTVWDNAQILDEHLRLRARYPDVKLLWAGDWSTFDGRNFWVTIVGLKSPYYQDVLDWCRDQGFHRDHCIAKMVSTWRPVEGTTKLMN